MRDCTAIVRQELGNGFHQVSTKEIEDSLWYYYYDTGKTVQWLRSMLFDAPAAQVTLTVAVPRASCRSKAQEGTKFATRPAVSGKTSRRIWY